MQPNDTKYLQQYHDLIGYRIKSLIENFNFSFQNTDLYYLTQAAAVFSSNIEGNSIDLNSFMNYKLSKEKFKHNKEIEEIENLISAYTFAQANRITESRFLKCHLILSKTLLIESKRGKYRNEKVGVFGAGGLAYLAVEPEFVQEIMKQFFQDIIKLIKRKLKAEEVFYFAALIHLIFAHIHPFMDGNGRAARLLEKWFIAEKLGDQYWKIPSEKYYKDNLKNYYANINLGVNYYQLNYDGCLPFLFMLPNCA